MDFSQVDECVCDKCKKTFESSYVYCPYCGKKVVKPKPKKKKSMAVIVVLILFVCAAIAGNLWIRQQKLNDIRDKAFAAMYHQNFREAKSYIDQYPDAETKFAVEYDYIEAGILLEERKYLDALVAFKNVNYTIPASLTEELTEKVYSLATTYYRRGEYLQSKKYFEEIKTYERSKDYLTLIKVHLSNSSQYYTMLLDLIGFEDTGEILVSEKYTDRFLRGTWRTFDKTYYFILRDNETVSENFPKSGYTITDGQNNNINNPEDNWRKHFSIKVIDQDTIEILSYKNLKQYKMLRE